MHFPKFKIKNVARVKVGFLNRASVIDDRQGTHSLIQLRDFNAERTSISLGAMTRFTPVNAEAGELQVGDVLFLAKGARNFAYPILDLEGPTLAASYFFILRPDESLNPTFLAWILNSEATREFFVPLTGQGVRTPVVRREVLEDLEIPVPPIEVQELIAEVIDSSVRQHSLLVELANMKRALATELIKQFIY